MDINLLILDDDAFYVSMLVDRLRSEADFDIQCVQAKSVSEAENAVYQAAYEIDCFLVDYKLGADMAGIDALQKLRLLSPDTEAILLTGYGNTDVGIQAYKAGAYRYLQKPFDIAELIWIIESIHGLRVLNQLAADAQRATSLQEVADVITNQSVKLGFERARFFLVDERASQLRGISQIGFSKLGDFSNVVFDMKDSPYAELTLSTRETQFFDGLSLGENFLAKQYDENEFPRPVGEWVDVALRDGEECIGILALDNYKRSRTYHAEQRRVLRLLSHQISGALSRAISEEKKVNELSSKITRIMADPDDSDSLNRLLNAIRNAIDSISQTSNYIVLLSYPENPEWAFERFRLENGVLQTSCWRRLDDNSLTSYVINGNLNLYLPDGVEAYRERKGFALVGPKSALSWMGVPLTVGSQVIGAIVMEHDERRNAFDVTDFNLFYQLAQQLSGVIQAAWLNEQKYNQIRQLELLQRVDETLPLLAEQRTEWLWHAVLTVATANYGLGFDRAALFLKGCEKSIIGVMGVGNFDPKQAQSDWERDKKSQMNFERYLDLLQSGLLAETAVGQRVRGWRIDLANSENAFSQVIHTQKDIEVTKAECHSKLPGEFIDIFDETDYLIVPVRAREAVIGILVLDNIWGNNPYDSDAIRHVDRLTDHAGSIHKNLQTSRAQVGLVEESYSLLAEASGLPIHSSLNMLCEKVKSSMGADIVAIYPLKESANLWSYDLENSASIGFDDGEHQPTRRYNQDSFTAAIMRSDIIALNSIDKHNALYGGALLRSHPTIAHYGIKSMIAVPIRIPNTELSGILYVDFCQTENFTAVEIQLAKSFAQVAGLILQQSNLVKAEQDRTQKKEYELKLLGDLLQQALDYKVKRQHLIETLLKTAHMLLPNVGLTASVAIWEWQRSDCYEPIFIRYQYYLNGNGKTTKGRIVKNTERGLSGYAYRRRKVVYVPDVHKPRWKGIYYSTNSHTKAELDIPIKIGDKILGVLCLESPHIKAFTNEHLVMAGRLADTAALSLENVERHVRLKEVARVAASASEKNNLDETLATVVRAILGVVPQISMITVWHRFDEYDHWTLGHSFGLKCEEELLNSFTDSWNDAQLAVDSTARHGKAVWANDSSQYRYRWFFSKGIIEREGICSSMAMPLRSNGKVIGVIYFHYREHHQFIDEEKSLFEILAESVGHAVNDSLHYKQINREKNRLEISHRITQAVGDHLALDQVITQVARELREYFHRIPTFPLVLLYNEFAHALETVAGVTPAYEVTNPQHFGKNLLRQLPVDEESFAGNVALKALRDDNEELHYLADVSDYKAYMQLRLQVASALCVPLMKTSDEASNSKKLVGVLYIDSELLDPFTSDDLEMIRNAAQSITIAIDRAKRIEDLRFRSNVIGATARLNPILHNINGELGKVRRYVDRLQSANLTNGSVDYVNLMNVSVDRLLEHVETTPLHESLVPIHIEPVLDSIFTDSTIIPKVSNLETRFDISHDAAVCLGHPNVFKQALCDMVRNGLDAMHGQSHKQFIVRTRPTASGNHVEIYIENNGPAIPERVQPKLFNEIYSTKSEQDGERGMGLLFVRAAIEGMKGRVQLHSSIEEATVFVVTLPVLDT